MSCLSKHKETSGNSRGVTESVRLEDCDESITNHLNTCHLSRETLKESQLILARAGIFDFPVSKLSEISDKMSEASPYPWKVLEAAEAMSVPHPQRPYKSSQD